MVLQAGLAALFSRLGAGCDIPIGTAIAGRTEAVLDPLIGFFVNTLVLRTDTGGDPTFRELLVRVRSTCLEAYAHQDVPFERLVELLEPPRMLGRQPLFQTMLMLHNTPQIELQLTGLHTRMLNVPPAAAKFDLSLSLVETHDGANRPVGLNGELEYNAELFDAATVEALVARFERLLAHAADEPSRRLHALAVVSAEERAWLIEDAARTADAAPGMDVIAAFEAQVARTPDAVALTGTSAPASEDARSGDDVELSYAG
jgi:non-ribosomal peptide synthetase component F